MNIRKLTLASFFAVSIIAARAQDTELLGELPTTKEGFVASEKNVVATVNWLENSPVNKDEAKRKAQYALLTAWITNSPTVTLTISADMIKFADKNPELLIMFMAGWTRYVLQNNYSADEAQGNLAGIRCAAKVYKAGALKKDKEMQKLIDLDEKGELETWVHERVTKEKKG